MKKIEATIDPETLAAVKLRLAEAGIGGRLTVIQANCLENIARFFQFEASGESPLKQCLRLDFIVSDRQAQSAINLVLQHAKPANPLGTQVQINIFSLDPTLESAPEIDCTAGKESPKSKLRPSMPNNNSSGG
jgi:nitrogen regulatory protein PII